MDKSGRIVLPRLIRERFGLTPDLELEVVEKPDGVLLRRREDQPSRFRCEKLGADLVG
jgi:AbrB family looped-hinge helix DNA binding protein